MGALKLPVNNVSYRTDFEVDLKKKGIDNVVPSSTVNTALKDTKSYQSSINSGSSFGFNDIVNAGVGATIFGALAQPVINRIKEAYEAKARSLGIGAYAEDPNSPSPDPKPLDAPIPEPKKPLEDLVPAKVPENSKLIEVLRQSSDNVGSISESLLYSNMYIVDSLNKINTSIEKLIEVTVLNGEVQQSYSDINLQLESTRHDVEVAYKEQGLQNHYDLIERYDSIIASSADFSHAFDLVSSRLGAVEGVNLLLERDLNTLDQRLTDEASSKADVKNLLETVIPKLDNLGVNIHRSENEIALTDSQLEHSIYKSTVSNITDLDGNVVANVSPRDAQTINDITSAKYRTDTNNFSMSDSDFDDMFDLSDIDISSIFQFSSKSDRLTNAINGA